MQKTAECCSPMHPDKMCDRISDAILDECLRQDPNTRAGIEVMGGHGIIQIIGEVTVKDSVSFSPDQIARKIAGDKFVINSKIIKQSPDIAKGVDIGGAGDQGIMIGYACRDNDAMIPNELYLARKLCKFLYNKWPADGKTQITLEDGKIKTIIASWCGIKQTEIYDAVSEWLGDLSNITDVIKKNSKIEIACNPSGEWSIGGFDADTGLTGRKLIVDNYGPQIPIGGGAFSGKDATKVDRSAAYAARRKAVQLLTEADESIKEVFVKLAYAIGKAEPVMAVAEIDGEEIQLDPEEFTPKNMIERFKLNKPQFEETAKWGAFGNDFLWDKC